jgi:hypothetical protein
MKPGFVLWSVVTSCLLWGYVCNADPQGVAPGLSRLLPTAEEVDGWARSGGAEFVEGEDLYLVINGGAEVYHEYGFTSAVFQSYGTNDGRRVNLEIYEMQSQESAYGVFTLKTGTDGSPVEVGYEGWRESYYLNFWKGNYLITLISLDTDIDNSEGIEGIARVVDSKMTTESKKPRIVSYLPTENLRTNGVTYLRGSLGLADRYIFDAEDIFEVDEGVVGEYTDYSLFLFKYNNAAKSKEKYTFVKGRLEHSNRFGSFVDRGDRFEVRDRKARKLSIKHHHNWILVVLGDRDTDAERVFASVERDL